MTACLYIGRFQPFHRGHMDVVEQIREQGYVQIVFGVGSSNVVDARNPRTYTQRKQMVEIVIEEQRGSSLTTEIVPLPDMSDDAARLAMVEQSVDFSVVMSGNPWVVKIFQAAGYTVLVEQERISIRATDVRQMLATQDPVVQQRVHPSIYNFLLSTSENI